MAALPNNVGVLMNGWFSEVNSQWPGQALSLEVQEVLFEAKSEYQHILVFKSKTWGNVLVLDGVIQLTERDEMAYQEMIAHLPLYSHSNPEHVLVIGGGDGGVIREIVKHDCVKSITICEIDRVVIEAGKRFFPSVAAAWDDPRVKLYEGDGAVFMKQTENIGAYDVIITDSSDPVGPAQSLFETPFYRAMYAALRPGGKVCTQAESMWINLDLIRKLLHDSLFIFANAEYATTQIPTYPAGQIGFLLCSKESSGSNERENRCSVPARSIPSDQASKYKFYSSALHSAAFIMPAFVQRELDAARAEVGATKKESQTSSENSVDKADNNTDTPINAKKQKI